MKKVDFSETIAACDLTLIDLMKICEFTCFSQKPLVHFNQILNVSLQVHMTKMAATPIYDKTL